MADEVDLVVVGGGLVGLATATAAARLRPGISVVVLEKESRLAAHQSGHNSGVIHSGVYYPPGSLKARFAIAGNRSMARYARERGLPVEVTGKLIVATGPDQLPALGALHRRGMEHGLAVRMLDPPAVQELEPHVRACAALHVASTGIVDYREVARSLAAEATDAGVEVHTGSEVRGADVAGRVVVETDHASVRARRLLNCAGLHSDRVARLCGEDPGVSIVPFRGEYYELSAEARPLVRGLVYPVPDPAFPFLGVHLTRDVRGGVHAGPNAVLALSREGYRWRDVSPRDLRETLAEPAFRTLARQHLRRGGSEMLRSASKALFLAEVRRLLPEIGRRDLLRSGSGVRAQALGPDGRLVDDFAIRESRDDSGELRALHVLNAPSPAATASLEIGGYLAQRLLT